jgi:hypothetical protein
MDQEDVLDETYRKAGKMDSGYFAPRQDPVLPVHSNLLWENIRTNLLEGTQSKRKIKTELYKLNVYGMYLIDIHLHLILRCCPGKGSFFKPHVDTPRSEKMFGSLVIVFPTPHEGGALLLRHRGQEWTFDSGKSLAAEREPSVGYVAFFSDIEHEVAPVISGHRITLTYNLYFDDGGPVSPNIEHLTHPQLENEAAFRQVFKGLLENPEFLADGGTLAFGLRHVYPIENNLKQVNNVLKGSDAVVYQSVRALGYEPVLHLYYQDDRNSKQGVIIDKVVDFPNPDDESDRRDTLLLRLGGMLVRDSTKVFRSAQRGTPGHREQVEWVTPVTEFNRQKGSFLQFKNINDKGSLEWAYGDVCLIVRIGRAGDRLAYTTVAELKRARRGDSNMDDEDDEDIDEDIEETE